MVELINEFFGLLGLDTTAPLTALEFMPWFMQFLLGFCLVAGFLQLIRWTVEALTKGGRSLL